MNITSARRALAALLMSSAALASASCSTPADGRAQISERCAMSAWAPENVRLTSATYVPAPETADGGRTRSGYCRIEGIVNERAGFENASYGIRFSLSLPDVWTERLMLQGGGGLNGRVPSPDEGNVAGGISALARGFAVVGHDSGHASAQPFDSSFRADQRAALDFAETSVRVVTETARAMTEHFYERPIAHAYMVGCSTGGREGMLAAQRYPELFDGIIVGAPAMRTGYSNLARAWAAVQFNQAAPRDDEGRPIVGDIFSSGDRELLMTGLLRQCDGLDGLSDGVIANVTQCRFDPGELQCARNKRDDCLSRAQVNAVRRAFSEPRDASGRAIYTSFPFDTGITFDGPGIEGFIPTGRPSMLGPANRELEIDIDARLAAIRADAMQRLTDTHVWTNLNTFTGRGGKILFYHGVSDPWFSANDTLDYWQRAQEANGASWDDASRFYFVPGMGHCGGGTNTFGNFDLLSTLVDWVEEERAPDAVIASRSTPTPAQRPLCAYPAYPHYIGGDESRAESFQCRAPDE